MSEFWWRGIEIYDYDSLKLPHNGLEELKLITIDSTPTKGQLSVFDWFCTNLPDSFQALYFKADFTLNEHHLTTSFEPTIARHLDQVVDYNYESFDGAFSNRRLKVVQETQISALAWMNYKIKSYQIEQGVYKDTLPFFQTTLKENSRLIKEVHTMHIVNIIGPLAVDTEPIDNLTRFNNCLYDAAIEGAALLGKQIVLVRS